VIGRWALADDQWSVGLVMRVIAGELKGRRLKTPTWKGLRPTSDKVRETLFNVLATRVPGARVLDLFAGTGAVGIEALSRGAAHATFVEDDVRAIKLIEQNLRQSGVSDRCAIIRFRLGARQNRTDLLQRMKESSFDLVVLDPPYDAPDLNAGVAFAAQLIAPGGLLVLEHARRRSPPEPVAGIRTVRTLFSGDTALTFYEALPLTSREKTDQNSVARDE
jgi:16S rRNA (guanine966-N2)-methyltransferase